jgi:multiple sugar transport system permease protein
MSNAALSSPAPRDGLALRFSTTEALKHAVLIVGALIVLLPFYVMVSYSLKSPQEIMTNTGGFIGAQEPFRDDYCVKLGAAAEDCMVTPVTYNYTTAFAKAPLLRYLLNGVFVTASIFLIQVLIALPCAYALAKLRFWGREAVFSLVLFCLLIPVHAIALPLYIMLSKLGLTNTYAALIVPWTISVFGIFLMRQFFMTVPDDLIDAARMDGMNEFSIIWRVMLPTAVPALLAFAIFSVVAHWNDYFWPRVVITGNRDLFTPPLGLREFKGDADGDNFGPMMATATVIVTPLIVAFLVAQRRFIEGITLSGMK